MLEDLHAADPASIELLEFVSGQTRALPLAHASARTARSTPRAPPTGPLLARVAARARTLALAPLTRDEVARQLEQALARAAEREPLVAAVHAATEGNPLFVRRDRAAAQGAGRQLGDARAALEARRRARS